MKVYSFVCYLVQKTVLCTNVVEGVRHYQMNFLVTIYVIITK